MLILSKRPFASLLSLIAVCTFSGGKVNAESISWTGSSSNAFSNAENWSGANTPPQSDDSLVFGTSGGGTLDNDLTHSAFNIAGMTFNVNAGAFVIGGNTFTLTGDVANDSTSVQTINASMTLSGVSTFTTTADGGNIILGGAINGGGQIVQQGGGVLVLTGINTLAGGVISNNGTLQLGDGSHAAEQRGGAGTNGVEGEAGSITPKMDGTPGGVGDTGGNAFFVNAGGTLNLSSHTTIVGGTGGNGGRGGRVLGEMDRPSEAFAGHGGDAGAGGAAIVVNGGSLSSLPSQSTVIGGAGGNGGETGYYVRDDTDGKTRIMNGQKGGSGGQGGAAVLFTATASWTSSGALIGGVGGITGTGTDRAASGGGGAGVILSEGGTLTNLGTIIGGEGRLGGVVHSDRETAGDTGRAGGDGGAGVVFGVSGSLVNSGEINGGRGGRGGNYDSSPRHTNTAGSGGDGGTAVTFNSGGSLTNSGTISGGGGGEGGVHTRGGAFDSYGATGIAGYGVLFSGGAGTLTNQSGGIINGEVAMDHFANDVTLETGSTINGRLDMGENASSTLTLTGSGSQAWSEAVSGTTSFAGSLSKEGDGTWDLDQPFYDIHTTHVNAGTLLVNISLAGDVTVESGARLGGAGDFGGNVTVRSGGTLSPGNSPGPMIIDNDLILENGSLLLMEFGGTDDGEYDQLAVQGSFTAGGTLSLMLIDGFTPEEGAMFTIFNGPTPGYDSGSFRFTTNLGGGLHWDTSDLASLGVLTVIPEPSSYVLLGFGCLAGALASQKRRKRA